LAHAFSIQKKHRLSYLGITQKQITLTLSPIEDFDILTWLSSSTNTFYFFYTLIRFGITNIIQIQDEMTYELLKTLHENPSQNQREMSKSLGISLGKLNYCLRALLDRGFLKVDNFCKSPRKSSYLYLLTAKGMDEKTLVTLRFLKRRIEEYEQLGKQIADLREELECEQL